MGKKPNNRMTYSTRNHDTILVKGGYRETALPGDLLGDLLRFYVLHTPCEKTSRQSRSFAYYGWKGDVRRNGLGEALEGAITVPGGEFLFPRNQPIPKDGERGIDLELLFNKAALTDGLAEDLTVERGAACNTYESNVWLRIFRHVRNCLAHGAFISVGLDDGKGDVLVMEDSSKGNYTARMILRLDTLVAWKDIIEAGPSPKP